MSNDRVSEPHKVEFDEVVRREPSSGEHSTIEDLYPVCLALTGDLGRCTMLVREVLELKRGSVVTLDKLAGETTDICINGIPMAKGEVVVIADSLHVRVADIVGTGEKDEPEE